MRFAAAAHLLHVRKGTDIPYLTHLAGVTLILARVGFSRDEVLCASLLHDCVEDTQVSLDDVARAFGDEIAALVDATSEVKSDAAGKPLPWRVRKEEQLRRLIKAPLEARAITLADKLHNLGTLIDDLRKDSSVWNRFNAPPSEQLWYYSAVLEIGRNEPALASLVTELQVMVEQLRDLIPSAAEAR